MKLINRLSFLSSRTLFWVELLVFLKRAHVCHCFCCIFIRVLDISILDISICAFEHMHKLRKPQSCSLYSKSGMFLLILLVKISTDTNNHVDCLFIS